MHQVIVMSEDVASYSAIFGIRKFLAWNDEPTCVNGLNLNMKTGSQGYPGEINHTQNN